MGLGHFFAGKVVGGGASAAPTKTAQPGTNLITEFEACRLTSYVCPAGVVTVGVGHTGPDVHMNMTITQAEADRLLAGDLDRFEKAVVDLIDVSLTQNEFDATVSFAFNCGAGALADSTFRKRINAGEDKATCFKEEFPRWTSGGMAGLVRRRDAEVALAIS